MTIDDLRKAFERQDAEIKKLKELTQKVMAASKELGRDIFTRQLEEIAIEQGLRFDGLTEEEEI